MKICSHFHCFQQNELTFVCSSLGNAVYSYLQVIIDWGPAMKSAREASMDSLLEQASSVDAKRASMLPVMPKTQMTFAQNSLFINTNNGVIQVRALCSEQSEVALARLLGACWK